MHVVIVVIRYKLYACMFVAGNCIAGQIVDPAYSPGSPVAECLACPQGSYQPDNDALDAVCTSCPTGQSTRVVGATMMAQCEGRQY